LQHEAAFLDKVRPNVSQTVEAVPTGPIREIRGPRPDLLKLVDTTNSRTWRWW
jgi:hypothetical protein